MLANVQIAETLQHAARSMPQAEQVATREMLSSFDAELKQGDDQKMKQDMIKKVVGTFVDTQGALEAAKEGENESSHVLLNYTLAQNFDTNGDEYAGLVKSLVDAVRTGGEKAVADGRTAKAESAARILTNTYNLLPASSPLRPTVLLALIQLLAASDDLAALPISGVSAALAQWSVSEADKVAFLTQAAAVYEKAGKLDSALTLTLLALERDVNAKTAEHALALALAQNDRFDLDDLLKVQGVRDVLTGKAAELVALFTSVDELEAVQKAAEWTKANGAYVSGLGVEGLDADEVLRKVRLIAIATLAARSASKTIAYADLTSALGVPEDEVEAWVIDAIRAGLLEARLSQPLSSVRVISVSSRATRRFGSDEWQLLERRLKEWKAAVDDALTTVHEAEALAAQGPITNTRPRRRQEQPAQTENN